MKSACITEKPNREKQHIPSSLTLFHIHLSYVILYLSLFLHMFPLPSLTHAINSCRFDADVCLNLLEYRELFLDNINLTTMFYQTLLAPSNNFYVSIFLILYQRFYYWLIYLHFTFICKSRKQISVKAYNNFSLFSSTLTIFVFAVLSQE